MLSTAKSANVGFWHT